VVLERSSAGLADEFRHGYYGSKPHNLHAFALSIVSPPTNLISNS
jgi:hypothetical protein